MDCVRWQNLLRQSWFRCKALMYSVLLRSSSSCCLSCSRECPSFAAADALAPGTIASSAVKLFSSAGRVRRLRLLIGSDANRAEEWEHKHLRISGG